ncbi:MAG: hypothetical protein ACOCVN_03355 [bacterium]
MKGKPISKDKITEISLILKLLFDMKTRYLILFLIVLFVSCNIFETEDQYPGVTLYKTKGDYFDLVTIGMKGDRIYSIPRYWNPRYNSISKRMEVKDNDTIYTRRCRLINEYILDGEGGLQSVFLDMTFKEYLKREIANAQKELGVIIPEDTLRKYILDKDPYLEYYQNNIEVKRLKLSDSLEIREIILNGEINKYFDKLK